MKLTFENIRDDEKKFKADIKPETIIVLVGRNGYGKTSFLLSLKEYLEDKKIKCLYWNDMQYGRSEGKSMLIYNGNMDIATQMMFHSEGESMMASFGYYGLSQLGSIVKRQKGLKEIFVLIDQLDSGLDVHQLNEIKNTLKDTAIPDMKKNGITPYIILTANSYETAEGETCMDPLTGKYMTFKDFEEYKAYIDKLYKEEEEKNKKSARQRSNTTRRHKKKETTVKTTTAKRTSKTKTQEPPKEGGMKIIKTPVMKNDYDAMEKLYEQMSKMVTYDIKQMK